MIKYKENSVEIKKSDVEFLSISGDLELVGYSTHPTYDTSEKYWEARRTGVISHREAREKRWWRTKRVMTGGVRVKLSIYKKGIDFAAYSDFRDKMMNGPRGNMGDDILVKFHDLGDNTQDTLEINNKYIEHALVKDDTSEKDKDRLYLIIAIRENFDQNVFEDFYKWIDNAYVLIRRYATTNTELYRNVVN